MAQLFRLSLVNPGRESTTTSHSLAKIKGRRAVGKAMETLVTSCPSRRAVRKPRSVQRRSPLSRDKASTNPGDVRLVHRD